MLSPFLQDSSFAIGPRAASLYLHIPFCFHKCHYCDFYSIVDRQDRQEPFTDRLVRELAALAPLADRPLDTIFVGGGTPSLLRVDLWQRLLAALDRLFDLSRMHAGTGEWTVECNPETVTPELMDTLRAGGVTRVSIGAQSFDRAHLKTLERWHEPTNVARAVELARAAGIARQSIDLIYAVPGQSLAHWEHDLDAALALGTEHLSCYALTYEPRTAMTARLERGEFTPADEDDEADMFERTLARLRTAGLERYEVSNFARPGAECRHNMAYWRQESWLAAGPSASGHLWLGEARGGIRWKNTPRLDDYLAVDDAGFAPIDDHEPADARRAATERIMTGLRLAEGLDAGWLASQAATHGVADPVRRRLAIARADGLLTDDPGRVCLTDSGFLVADRLAAELMACFA